MERQAMSDRPRIGVGNLRLEGCNSCELSVFVTNLLANDEPTESLAKHHGVGKTSHLLIELNGAKRPGDCAKPEPQTVEFGDTELLKVGGIAVRLGVEDEDIDDFAKKFEKCASCPNAIDWNADSFALTDNGPVLFDEWKKTTLTTPEPQSDKPPDTVENIGQIPDGRFPLATLGMNRFFSE